MLVLADKVERVSGRGHVVTYKSAVSDELASKPEEGLFKVVVGLGGDIVVLQVLFPVEGDGLGLDLALLHVDLVAAKNNGDILANAGKIT
jgi:hypothetical protein